MTRTRARERGSILFPILEIQVLVILLAILFSVAVPLLARFSRERFPENRCAVNIVRIVDGAAPASLECPWSGTKYDGPRCPNPGEKHLPAPPRLSGPGIPAATVSSPASPWTALLCSGMFLLFLFVTGAANARGQKGCAVAIALLAVAAPIWFYSLVRARTVRIEAGGGVVEIEERWPLGLGTSTTRLDRVRALVASARADKVFAVHHDVDGTLRVTALHHREVPK